MNHFVHGTALATLLLTVTACSTTNMTATPYEEGWRRARVESLGDIQASSSDRDMACQTALKGQADRTHLAVVSYSYGGNPNLRARRQAVVNNNDALAPGDTTYVKLGSCLESLQLASQLGRN
jgi:hypothetical protein